MKKVKRNTEKPEALEAKSEVIIHATEIVLIDPKSIELNERNYNTHPDDQIETLAKGIEYYGFRDPIVISKLNGVCPEGEGRILAAIKLGMAKIPVMFQEFSSKDLQEQYGLFHNGIAKQSQIDLSRVHVDLSNWGPDFDLLLTGIKGFELTPLNIDEPEPRSDPKEKDTELIKCPNCGVLVNG